MGWCHPIADGYLLKDTLANLQADGKIKDIPYMVGSNADDLGIIIMTLSRRVVKILFI